jgi:hypothetical protein
MWHLDSDNDQWVAILNSKTNIYLKIDFSSSKRVQGITFKSLRSYQNYFNNKKYP